MKGRFIILLLSLSLPFSIARGVFEDELPFTDVLSTAESYLKAGYALLPDTWGGELAAGESHTVTCQLFRGVRYVFVAGAESKGNKFSVQVQDNSGAPVKIEPWQKTGKKGASCASACVEISRTGSYRIVVKLESCREPRAAWALFYAYR